MSDYLPDTDNVTEASTESIPNVTLQVISLLS